MKIRTHCKKGTHEWTKSNIVVVDGRNRCAPCYKAKKQRYYFGENRELAIQRDGGKCVECGMTREQHREKYGRDINVDHIDKMGVSVPKDKKNNGLSNLQTLCASCHTRKDSRRLTDSQVINIFHIGESLSSRKVAKLYGTNQMTVINIRHKKQLGAILV